MRNKIQNEKDLAKFLMHLIDRHRPRKDFEFNGWVCVYDALWDIMTAYDAKQEEES